MGKPRNIHRKSARDLVVVALRDQVVGGDLSPGERIDVSAVAEDLGVSATPVREALLDLHRQGLIDAPLGRGFRVRPLSSREAEELSEVISSLESRALRSAPPVPEKLDELATINEALRGAKTSPERVARDDEWHGALLERCTNSVLLEMRAQTRERLRRYEIAYMTGADRVAQSAVQHDDIIAALRAGRVDDAADTLERNWHNTVEFIVERMRTEGGD